jgi:hypothetical protein
MGNPLRNPDLKGPRELFDVDLNFSNVSGLVLYFYDGKAL